jgi:hypothetical protein
MTILFSIGLIGAIIYYLWRVGESMTCPECGKEMQFNPGWGRYDCFACKHHQKSL